MGANATLMVMDAFVHLDTMDYCATTHVPLVLTVLGATVCAPVRMVVHAILSMENANVLLVSREETVKMAVHLVTMASTATKHAPRPAVRDTAIVCLETVNADQDCSDRLAI